MMKKALLIQIVLFCLLWRCNSNENRLVEIIKTNTDSINITNVKSDSTYKGIKPFFIKDFSDKFLFENVVEFKRGVVEKQIYKHKPNGRDTTIGIEIQEKDLELIYQNTMDNEIFNGLDGNKAVFYGKRRINQYQSIIIFGLNGGWNYAAVMYNYDLKGFFIDKSYLYMNGGDGGNYDEAWGQFVNDSTYLMTHISCELQDDDTKNSYSLCDSSVIEKRINYLGYVTTKILFKKSYKK